MAVFDCFSCLEEIALNERYLFDMRTSWQNNDLMLHI
jgi:hypothetical protein